MIIQIVGTSGSGKSHLMRSVMKALGEDFGGPEEVFEKGRASPLYYLYPGHSAVVLGAYTSPTGGCDTINDVSKIFDLTRKRYELGNHVLFEGLFCMNQTRGPQLAAEVGKDFSVLQLTTPLAACFVSVNERRAERGDGELANRKNTTDNYKRAENYSMRMREAGARVFRVSRDEGLDKMLELLGVN